MPFNSTEDIVRAAQQGDTRSFGLLFELHHAGMLAVALRILGSGPDAEDACQDAAITAFGRIADLRDPSAIRPWLHAIVRNNSLTMLRARKPVPAGMAPLASDLDDPEACLERSAQRDWIRHALRQLSPATQAVAMLRYFTGNNAYEQIAALCGTPVGTVRSRLSEARRQLAVVLPAVHDERHDEAAALNAERHEEAAAILTAISRGVPMSRVGGRWAKDMTIHWPLGRRSVGLKSLFEEMQRDYDDGVTARVTGVVAGSGITVWENDFINPPEDPFHCPPSGTWLLREKNGLVDEARFLLTPRPEKSSPETELSVAG